MELVIDAVDESGPCGLPALFVAHYGIQNGDPMGVPEMCFELGSPEEVHRDPLYWRNDYICRRAVEPQHHRWALRVPLAIARAARTLRQDMGQQPATAGFRRSLYGQVHSRLVRSP